jgi:ATP-binding cassette subfamily A (ABC1) protein 1
LRISDVSSEEIYQLPLDCVNTFEKLFNSLDDNLDSLGIESYGISITTLEEVFLSVND